MTVLVDPASTLLQVPDEPTRASIQAWRHAERKRLIADRLALPAATRRLHTAALVRHLDALLGVLAGPWLGQTVGVYWPLRGEPNLRPWMARLHAGDARCALPVVVQRSAPLVFRPWQPGAAMVRGVWNIPEPADGPEVLPDIVIAPVVGFDRAGYRLGHGGGYYDRTLAAWPRRPLVIGVGFEQAAIASIRPLPHDIAMQAIVTECGYRLRRGPGLPGN